MATPLGQHPTLFCKHYASQFHPKYNPQVADLVKAANVSNWPDLFRAKNGDIEIPVALGQPRQAGPRPVGDHGSLYRRRDARRAEAQSLFLAGRQRGQPAALYRPASTSPSRRTSSSLMLDAISGRLDIQERHIDTLQNKPTLSQNMQKGDYRLVELDRLRLRSRCQIYLNITHKDPKMREMFANKDFRQALVAGHQPQGNHRHRLSRPVRALPDRAAPGPSLVQREAARASSPITTRSRRTRSSTSSATPSRTRRASACVPTGRRCSSPSTSSRRSIPTPWTRWNS